MYPLFKWHTLKGSGTRRIIMVSTTTPHRQRAEGGRADPAHTGRSAQTTHEERKKTMIEVRNRKLEQFYYAHGVDFMDCRKDLEEGLTVWIYEDNEENRRILDEWKLAIRRREAKRNNLT